MRTDELEREAYQRGDLELAGYLAQVADAEEVAERVEDREWRLQQILDMFNKPNTDWPKRKKAELLEMLHAIREIITEGP
jgi:hypothetical protein